MTEVAQRQTKSFPRCSDNMVKGVGVKLLCEEQVSYPGWEDGWGVGSVFIWSCSWSSGCGVWPTTPWLPAATWKKQSAVSPSARTGLSWPWAWRTALSLFSESGTFLTENDPLIVPLLKVKEYPGHKICHSARKSLTCDSEIQNTRNPDVFGKLFGHRT